MGYMNPTQRRPAHPKAAFRSPIAKVFAVVALVVATSGCSSSGTGTIASVPTESGVPAAIPSSTGASGIIEQPAGDMNATLLSFLEDPRMEEAANGTFHTFVRLVSVAGLTSIFSGPGPMALFPPTDEAFARTFTPAQLEKLASDQVGVAELINFEAANGIWPLSKVNGGIIPTMQVNELHGTMTEGVLRINNAVVRAQAVHVSNGYIYAMNDVLTPPGFQIPAGA
jgi:uncharacterized surface protein with fasciclin (FAS1) repeats